MVERLYVVMASIVAIVSLVALIPARALASPCVPLERDDEHLAKQQRK